MTATRDSRSVDPTSEAVPSVPVELPWPPVLKSRGLFRLSTDRVFGPVVLGMMLSSIGMWSYNVVGAILAFQLTGSAFMVGLVSVAQFAPQLLLSPLSGTMADRGDRRVQLILGRFVVVAGSGGLAVWIALVGVSGLPGAWPVIGAAGVVGLGFSIGGPALNALIPSLVRPEEIGPAIALSNIPNTVARAAGPAIGALLATSAGPAVAIGVAAAGNLIFALILLVLPVSDRAERIEGVDSSMRACLRQLKVDPPLALLLIGVAAAGIGADPVITLTPALSHGLGHGTDLVGAFASSFGVGAGVSLTLFSPIRRWFGLDHMRTLGLGLFAIATLGLTVMPAPAFGVVAFGFAGAGMMLSITALSTEIQMRVPASMRGRMMALWAMAFLGTRPLAAAFDGAIADHVSLNAALASVGVLLLAATWLSNPRRLVGLAPAA